MAEFRYYPENPSNPFRLGRHQMHSFLTPRKAAGPDFAPIRTVTHQEFQECFDQGNLGSCTANAALGCLVTAPFATKAPGYTEQDAVVLYELETKLDGTMVPGSYPPDDTGSSGPWSMMALEQQGKIASFQHTTDVYTLLTLLTGAPVSIGVPWFASMFNVDKSGSIEFDPSSQLAGGHQVCLVGLDTERQAVQVRNSWGSTWGQDGHAWLSWAALGFLFTRGGGDAVQPIQVTQ